MRLSIRNSACPAESGKSDLFRQRREIRNYYMRLHRAFIHASHLFEFPFIFGKFATTFLKINKKNALSVR